MRLEDALRGNAQANKTNVTKGEIYSLRRIISRINLSRSSQPLLCQGGKKKEEPTSCEERRGVMLWMHPQLGCCAFLVCSVESSGNLLWLTNSSKTHLLKKHKLRRTKGAREEQRALLINGSLARRFVCLILPASTFFFFRSPVYASNSHRRN